MPFENSTNGAVIFTLELLADRQGLYSDIYVCGEAYLNVSHCLLGHKPPPTAIANSPAVSGTSTPTSSFPVPMKPKAKPLSDLKHIKRIHSHPQAYGQCEAFLGAYLKGVDRREENSTSGSAEIVKEDLTRESAAIASSLSAEIHGLEILAEGIEDREDNTTRFLVIRRGIHDQGNHLTTPTTPTTPTKSLISFTVDHSSPGALADVLECFRHRKLNLTSINSRPTTLVRFQYIFFVEFEGSRLCDPDGRVEGALESIKKYTQCWRWLGSWDDKLQK